MPLAVECEAHREGEALSDGLNEVAVGDNDIGHVDDAPNEVLSRFGFPVYAQSNEA